MNFFTFDIKKWLTIFILIALPLIAVNFSSDTENPWFLKPFGFVSGVVQTGYTGFSSGVKGTVSLYVNLIDIKKNNRLLTDENMQLRAQLGELSELRLENERLNDLLGFQKKTKMSLLAVKVVGKDLVPDHSTLTINKGSYHGIRNFMPAITNGGVVGYVADTQAFTSQILLLTDRYASIDSLVQRSRARGLIEGWRRNRTRLNYLKRQDDVQIGDLIVTSGLNKVFPKGFPVGVVTDVRKNEYDVSQSVYVKPTVNLDTLEELFIILNSKEEDFEETFFPAAPGQTQSTPDSTIDPESVE